MRHNVWVSFCRTRKIYMWALESPQSISVKPRKTEVKKSPSSLCSSGRREGKGGTCRKLEFTGFALSNTAGGTGRGRAHYSDKGTRLFWCHICCTAMWVVEKRAHCYTLNLVTLSHFGREFGVAHKLTIWGAHRHRAHCTQGTLHTVHISTLAPLTMTPFLITNNLDKHNNLPPHCIVMYCRVVPTKRPFSGHYKCLFAAFQRFAPLVVPTSQKLDTVVAFQLLPNESQVLRGTLDFQGMFRSTQILNLNTEVVTNNIGPI